MTLYIAAPFGNYLKSEVARSVTGSFTLERRTGLLKRIATTLRYRDGAWYNAIGLRNPGIEYGLQSYSRIDNDVLSLAAIEPGDWKRFSEIVPHDIDVELNLSCPNIEHFENYTQGIDKFLNDERKVIAKLSPHTTKNALDDLIQMGFRSFHFCNTLPTDNGGKSGKDLIPYVEKLIRYFNELITYKHNLPAYHFEIIAGGGITSIENILSYQNLGANSYSLGTVCFNPIKYLKLIRSYRNSFYVLDNEPVD